ncbi:hypothetical protein F4781DRAFT_312237 [Annulohypoxylon bovei var. microspora]|nr:hypothetical protein F4781DRAFT_312237 [Annulohypoxylon bovei var. microspora]
MISYLGNYQEPYVVATVVAAAPQQYICLCCAYVVMSTLLEVRDEIYTYDVTSIVFFLVFGEVSSLSTSN